MCTLYLFHADKKESFSRQINADWPLNPDGGTVIMIDDYDDVVCRVQTVEKKMLLSAIKTSKAAKYIVHLRASTGIVGGVAGCHGFDSPDGRYIYCHNGIISGQQHLRVDSLVIGEHLDEYGTCSDIAEYGDYVNLIVYDTTTGKIVVHRGGSGTLHTDGQGNWSTKRINRHFSSVQIAGWYSERNTLLKKTDYPERVQIGYRYLSTNVGAYHKCDWCKSYKPDTFVDDYSHDRVCPSCIQRTYGITADEYKRLAETEIAVINDINAETETDNNDSE